MIDYIKLTGIIVEIIILRLDLQIDGIDREEINEEKKNFHTKIIS